MKKIITMSRSGHYTATVKADNGTTCFQAKKLNSLARAREEIRQYLDSLTAATVVELPAFTKGQNVVVSFPLVGRQAEGHVTSYPVLIEHSDERGDEWDYSRVGVQFPHGFAYIPIKQVRAK